MNPGENEGGTDAKIKLCNGETIQHVPLLPILVKNRRRRRREEEVTWCKGGKIISQKGLGYFASQDPIQSN